MPAQSEQHDHVFRPVVPRPQKEFAIPNQAVIVLSLLAQHRDQWSGHSWPQLGAIVPRDGSGVDCDAASFTFVVKCSNFTRFRDPTPSAC